MATRRTRLCVVGACGRMGGMVIREAPEDRFEVTGAIESTGHPQVGRTLQELGLGGGQVRVQDSSSLRDALLGSDVCVSFTGPEAEVENAPAVAEAGTPLVMGTTGFTPKQRERLDGVLKGRIAAVITSNFSIGANLLFGLASSVGSLPKEFDVSISEIHHAGKADAPSGTALRLGEVVSKARGYTRTVNGRSGASRRKPDELEILSLRGGGVPGEHSVFAFGPHEVIRLDHLVFSRSAFAQGALLAAEWLSKGREKGVYTMADVLGFTER